MPITVPACIHAKDAQGAQEPMADWKAKILTLERDLARVAIDVNAHTAVLGTQYLQHMLKAIDGHKADAPTVAKVKLLNAALNKKGKAVPAVNDWELVNQFNIDINSPEFVPFARFFIAVHDNRNTYCHSADTSVSFIKRAIKLYRRLHPLLRAV